MTRISNCFFLAFLCTLKKLLPGLMIKKKKKKNDLGGALTTSLLFIWLSAHIPSWLSAHIPSLWPRHLTLSYAFFFFLIEINYKINA